MVVRGGSTALHADGGGEGEGFENGVVNVAAHVAESAGAEVEPLAPVAGVVEAVADERALGGDAQPFIPIEFGGRGVCGGGHLAVVAPLFAAPCVDFFDFPDGSGLHEHDGGAVLGGAVNLDAHLGDEFLFAGDFGEAAAFVEVVGERLLPIDVHAALEGRHADGGVHVVGRGDVDRLKVFLLFQQLAEVGVDFCVGEFFEELGSLLRIHIARGDDVHGLVASDRGDIRHRHARAAERGVADAGARRLCAKAGGHPRRDDETGGELL